jgi:metal-responsive CopG/Arc/MetJ family transcriptional regulator
MSQIISFSADKSFAEGLEGMIEKSGYQNRSKFLRDAAIHYAEVQQRGELENMKDDQIVEGHLVIYYQHGIEHKMMDVRHSNKLEITSYSHSCLPHSHTCVDVMHAIGTAAKYREAIEQLQNIPNVDKVTLISAPMRDDGCC